MARAGFTALVTAPEPGSSCDQRAGEDLQESALGNVAEALAATDPDRVERIAQTMTGDITKAEVLVKIAEAWSQG